MPTGRIQHIDEDQNVVYIVRQGRIYRAPLNEVESKARVASARVRFDLIRESGSESGANVRLRTGTRTNRRHRRFGDLSGAKRPGSKVTGSAKRSFGVDVTTQPFRVAEAWLEAMDDYDYDGATSLYQSRAALHTPHGSVTGRRQIRSELEKINLQQVDIEGMDIRGIDRYVKIACSTEQGGEHTIYLEIDSGAIIEQWVDCEPDIPSPASDSNDVQLVRRGDVVAGSGHYAEQRIRQLIEHTGRDVRFSRVKLTAADNPAVELPAMVEATIEFDNGLVRAHASAATFTEATDHVTERLRRQVESQRDRKRHRTTALPAPADGWQHGNRPRVETPYFDRAEAEREIVRHKSIATDEMTVDEAAWDMMTLDYEFFLFVDLESGQDSLLERNEASFILRQVAPKAAKQSVTVIDYETVDRVAPKLLVSEALTLLNETGELRLFFSNRSSGRANVIYRRYDGHYGLITPSADASTTDHADDSEGERDHDDQ